MQMDFNLAHPITLPPTLTACHHLLTELWQRCQEQNRRIKDLEERLGKNPSNSSLPPSSEPLYQKQARRQHVPLYSPGLRKRGAQPGHVGHGRKLVPLEQVHEVIPCYPSAVCDQCGGEVSHLKLCQRRQVTDLQQGLCQVQEYQLFKGRCQRCHKSLRATLPSTVPPGAFGVQVVAKIAALTAKYRLSRREAKSLLQEFCGLTLSLGSISRAEQWMAEALAVPVKDVASAIAAAPVVGIDETSHARDWTLKWLWVVNTPFWSYFRIFGRRNQASAKTLLTETYAGKVMSDRHGAYHWLEDKQHQYCWSHLLRDFAALAEKSEPTEKAIGRCLMGQARQLLRHWHRARTVKDDHSARLLTLYQGMIRHYLQRGATCKGTATARFCAGLLSHWDALWPFLGDSRVEPTNNGSERALRHYVLWRKKSLGTQSERGDQYVERLLTVVISCQQQSRSVLNFLQDSLTAYWQGHGLYPCLVPP